MHWMTTRNCENGLDGAAAVQLVASNGEKLMSKQIRSTVFPCRDGSLPPLRSSISMASLGLDFSVAF